MSDDKVKAAMARAGWRYVAATNGYRKGDAWVSAGQAADALDAAMTRRDYAPEALSETCARIIVDAMKDKPCPSTENSGSSRPWTMPSR